MQSHHTSNFMPLDVGADVLEIVQRVCDRALNVATASAESSTHGAKAGSVRGRPAVKKRGGRRARLVFALNSDRYGLVRAAHSRVHFGQEAKSAQNGPCEKSRPDFSLPARRLESRPLLGPLRPCGTGFPSGQARRVHRRVQSRTKCSNLKCRIPVLWLELSPGGMHA